MMAHVAAIVSATDLPTSADLENGFGDDPKTVAETIGLAAAAGLAGCSIEDMSKDPNAPIYAFEQAVERIEAAASVSRALPFQFTRMRRRVSLDNKQEPHLQENAGNLRVNLGFD